MRGRPRKNNIPLDAVKDVIEAYTREEKPLTLKELAVVYKVTPYTVRHVLNESGVPIRKRGKQKVKPTGDILTDPLPKE